MRFFDLFRLSIRELRYNKKETICSVFVLSFLFVCLFLTGIVSEQISNVGSNIYQAVCGYESFSYCLFGYEEEDLNYLTSMGFKNLSFSKNEITGATVAYGELDDITRIGWYKVLALSHGREIRGEEGDELLELVMIGRVIFIFLGILSWIVVIVSLSNSLLMKKQSRKNFFMMLSVLGGDKSDRQILLYFVFGIRMLFSFFVATLVNLLYIGFINRYINDIFMINDAFSVTSSTVIPASLVLTVLLLYWIIHKDKETSL